MFWKKRPYLFWELISAGVLVLGFGAFALGAVNEAGEWIYPVLVFSFILGAALAVSAPIIISYKRKRMIPDSAEKDEEIILRGKVKRIEAVRNAKKLKAAMPAIYTFVGFFALIFLAYVLGEYVNILLGLICLGAAAAVPPIAIATNAKLDIKRFYKVEHGEKLIDLKEPSDFEALRKTNAITLILLKEPSAALLNFLYNWLCDYIYGRRISAYLLSVSDLRLKKSVINEIFCGSFDGKYFLCIPCENLKKPAELGDLAARLKSECEAVCVFPLNTLVE